MAIELTNNTIRALQETNIEPNLIVRIDGLSTLFSARPVREFIKYGDDIFYGDSDLFYGGLTDIPDQKNYVDGSSTTFKIRQQINYDDEAGGSSISSMTIGLVDKNEEVTKLISPGFDLEDVLGRKIEVFQSFGDTDFFDDSILVFKGIVTKIESLSGLIKLKINHPDRKKNVNLFQTTETQLDGAINSSQVTIDVDSVSNFVEPRGPLSTYLRIDDEIMQYTGITGNQFTGLTRGALGTTESAHDDNAQVRALYSLEGNPFDLALQIMMSGFGTNPVHEDVPVTKFVQVGNGNDEIANAIFFDEINIPQDFGISIGDQVTTTGANNGANNFVQRNVTDVQAVDSGYYIVVDGAALVVETESPAVCSFFSQYNTLPDGMKMKPEEVDIAEHLRIRDLFFSGTQYRLYIKEDSVEGKVFLDEQIYRPIACYSIPRKTQASVGYTVGPIPGEDITTLSDVNVKNARDVSIVRTTNRSFFNRVVYKYDDDPADQSERFLSGLVEVNQTAVDRIGSTKDYVVESIGLRTDLNAQNITQSNSQRILDRYKFAAEIVTCRALLRDSVAIEIGDIVIGEFLNLKTSDITKGNRQFDPRLFEVQNKSINLKTGDTELTLLDTGINIDARFGLISPSSRIAGIISNTQIVIGPDSFYGGKFGNDEFRKWANIISINQPISVVVRNDDYSISEDLVVTDINENTFTLQAAPGSITLEVGQIIEFSGYVDSDTSDKQKLVYAYMTDDPAFPDGGNPYSMI